MTEPTETGAATVSTPQYRRRARGKKPFFITLALIVVAAVVAAVLIFMNLEQGGSGPGGDSDGENGGDGSANGGGGGSSETVDRELVVGLTLEPNNLDVQNTGGVALDQIFIDNVYQGLIGLNSGTLDDFVPVLAESLPEVSDDGLAYTFTLREDVRFHSGNVLTSADVVDSLGVADTQFSLAGALGTEVTVSASDERTVIIELASPNSQLFWHLANRPGLILESAFAGDLASTANGTGPYIFEEWRQGDSITFVANDDYWGEDPTLDTVTWRYIADANAAVNAALSGDIDVLTPVNVSLTAQFEGTEFDLVRASSTDVFTLAYNTQREPLNDVRVRQALSQAIDSEAIIDAFNGDGKALGGPITDIEAAYEDLTDVNPYDPEAARALLAEAGVTDLALSVTFPNHYPTDAINIVVTQFAEIGVTLTVETVEFSTWLSDVYAAPEDGSPRPFDLSYVNHVEPNDFFNYVNLDYYLGGSSEEARALYAEAMAESDMTRASELTAQAARLIAEAAPAKWLINYTPTNAIGAHVSGFPDANTNSRLNLAGVTVDEG